jgi:hypothetical protein
LIIVAIAKIFEFTFYGFLTVLVIFLVYLLVNILI